MCPIDATANVAATFFNQPEWLVPWNSGIRSRNLKWLTAVQVRILNLSTPTRLGPLWICARTFCCIPTIILGGKALSVMQYLYFVFLHRIASQWEIIASLPLSSSPSFPSQGLPQHHSSPACNLTHKLFLSFLLFFLSSLKSTFHDAQYSRQKKTLETRIHSMANEKFTAKVLQP